MNVMGPRRCHCCGEEERTSGCVLGLTCGCRGYTDCLVCRFCLKHCNCTEQMKSEASAARLQYHETLRQIGDRNPGQINKRW
jgi:hypothetical protein